MGAIADAIAAYAQPLLDQTDGSEEQLKKAFALSQLCFNFSLLPEDIRDREISNMQQSVEMDDEEFEDFRRSIVVPMIRRHQEMFPLMHKLDPADSAPRGPWFRKRPTGAERATAYAGTDPYTPCPCGSGEKYKFCCGKKRR